MPRQVRTILVAMAVVGLLASPGSAGAQPGSVEPAEFAARFADCSPATTMMMFRTENALITVQYEITGPSSDFCAVKVQYLLHPNRAWIGPEMTCELDQKKEIDVALEDLSRCTGPLNDLRTAGR